MKHVFSLLGAVLVLSLGAAWLRAAPPIGPTSVAPSIITANVPTAVTITALITDQSLIASSVNLLRLGSNSSTPTVIATLRDDGIAGDALANDGVFSRTHTFTERAGTIPLQVSAAFRGHLTRSFSPVISVQVRPGNVLDSTGGTIVSPDGVTMAVPEGSLRRHTLFHIGVVNLTQLPSNLLDRSVVSGAIEIIPIISAGQVPPLAANYSAQITAPLYSYVAPGARFDVFVQRPGEDTWEDLGPLAVADGAGKVITFRSEHIGLFIFVRDTVGF
jgi:hypothetical protein